MAAAQTQAVFLSLITNQSNNTRENGKLPFVVDKWQLPSIDNKRYFPIFLCVVGLIGY
jgi:hypothetical protein